MHRTRDVARWRGRVGVGMLIGSLGLGIDASAQSATFPSRPIRIIVPYPPGGLGDIFPRGLAAASAEPLGQQIVIENRPGATQIIGALAAVKATPDGHTLFFGSVTSIVIE